MMTIIVKEIISLKNIVSKIKSIEVLFYIFYIEISVPFVLILVYSISSNIIYLSISMILYNIIFIILLKYNSYKLKDIKKCEPIESFLDFTKLN